MVSRSEHHGNSSLHTKDGKPLRSCGFCNYRLPRRSSPVVMKGEPLKALLASSAHCSICMELNKLLQKYSSQLHDFGQSATLRFDVHVVSPEDIPETAQTFPGPNLGTKIHFGLRPPYLRYEKLGRFSSIIEQSDPNLFYSDMSPFIEQLSSRTEPSMSESAVSECMRSCLDTCLIQHDICEQDRDPSWLPTRLIDTKNMTVMLSTRISKAQDRRYVALSHQWGTEDFFKLTRENLNEINRWGIYRGQLRRTFCDAIDFTRALGVRYLWIDSLCIIQGPKDQSEWHREAASMAQVYRNAIVTLVASHATSLEDGFLTWKRESPTDWLEIGIPDENYLKKQILLSVDPEKPLGHRGWALQEHLLAPRTIHFSDPVVWECREMTVKQRYDKLSIFPHFSTTKLWTSGLQQQDCRTLWNRIVANYSDCQLSEPSDKLVAIGGLAKIFAGVLRSDYLAGHWGPHLIEDLLWETSSNAIRVSKYRAPSWSWASLDGRIKFQTLSGAVTSLVDILETEVSPLKFDNFGEIRSGFLRVNSRLLLLGALSNRGSPKLTYSDEFLRVSLDELPTTQSTQLYLLPLLKLTADDEYWSLLLKRSKSIGLSTVPEYQRLGVVTTFMRRGQAAYSDINAPWMHSIWWSSAFYPRDRKPGHVARAFRTEDFEGGRIHTIDLV